MTEYRVKQIQPNHADHISGYKETYLNEMLKNEEVVAQPKYDGERMLIHIDKGHIYCTSRRFSKKTGRYMENQERIPVVYDIFKNLLNINYTVIDCECYSKNWSAIAGILHSLPERAIELQKENPVKFACFDLLFLNGMDLREKSYGERYVFLNDLLLNVENRNCHIVKSTYVNSIDAIKDLMLKKIDEGFEGIVVKSFDRKYYDKAASLKCKKFETVDVVVCGYQDGNGKYSNSVGALQVGYYDPETKSVVQISKVNCGTDEDREFWNSHREQLLNSVIEVKCQEITERSLRHPVYIRRRDDKSFEMCTKETIFK